MNMDDMASQMDDLKLYDVEFQSEVANGLQNNYLRLAGDLFELGHAESMGLSCPSNSVEIDTHVENRSSAINLLEEFLQLDDNFMDEINMTAEEEDVEDTTNTADLANYITNLSNSCTCSRNCYETHERSLNSFFQEVITMTKMERKQMAYTLLTVNHETKEIRRRIDYSLPFVGSVCKSFFLSFFKIGGWQIRSLLKMLAQRNSLKIRPHGNSGNSFACVSVDTQQKVKEFLKNLAKERAEPIGVRRFVRRKENGELATSVQSENWLLLPSHFSQDGLHILYNKTYPEHPVKSRMTFLKIWNLDEELKWVKIRSPSSDVCDDCHIMKLQRNELHNSTDEELDMILMNHISAYKECRAAYEESIKRAIEDTHKKNFTSIAFDFQQNQECPKIPQQPGCWYYWCPLKIHTFGLVDSKPSFQLKQGPLFEVQEGRREFLVFVIFYFFLRN